MISSLPGKALRTLVDIARLAKPRDSTCLLKAEPDKLDIKRHEPGILLHQFTHCFTLQNSDNDIIFDFCVDSASLATSFKKCNAHDLIKAHAVR